MHVQQYSSNGVEIEEATMVTGHLKFGIPLFRERGVADREQLEWGVMLLERNVDRLLRMKRNFDQSGRYWPR